MKNILSIILISSLVLACSEESKTKLTNNNDDGRQNSKPEAPLICNVGDEPQGIINGKFLSKSSSVASHIVFIVQKLSAGHTMCTGTIIDDNFILTAAHCIDDAKSIADLMVYVNTEVSCDKKSNSLSELSVADYGVHRTYGSEKSSLQGDIGLIKIKGPIPNHKKPVKLAKKIDINGSRILVAGFGKSESSKKSDDQLFLRYGFVKPGKTWEASLKEKFLHFDQSEKNGVCMGDSGGPAFQKQDGEWVQIGVASHVIGDLGVDSCHKESKHINILYYSDWIEEAKLKLNN
jgi:secreted trypsin-like serine protease